LSNPNCAVSFGYVSCLESEIVVSGTSYPYQGRTRALMGQWANDS